VLKYNVIPVVLNGANMSEIAPPHSYIDFEDFSTVKDLANYLKQVAEDDQLFASYFWWRDYYTVKSGWENTRKAYCSMCEALHDSTRKTEVIKDMRKYWEQDAKCRSRSENQTSGLSIFVFIIFLLVFMISFVVCLSNSTINQKDEMK